MQEDWYRQITAQTSAHVVLITMLLRVVLRDLARADAQRVGDAFKAQFEDTTFLRGAFLGDEASCERLADITIQMRQHIAELIDRAIAGLPVVPATAG